MTTPAGAPDASRAYPSQPVAGVGGVVFTPDRHIVLIRRGQAPLSGTWSLPGGVLELGESLAQAVVREVREETGLDVEAGPLIDLFEHIARDEDGRVRYHYVIADYLCHARGGRLTAGSDALEVALANPLELDRFNLTPKAQAMIRRACALAGFTEPADRPGR
ncbi:MAG: NUDIX hydrolase [Acidobacteriota bacterium]